MSVSEVESDLMSELVEKAKESERGIYKRCQGVKLNSSADADVSSN